MTSKQKKDIEVLGQFEKATIRIGVELERKPQGMHSDSIKSPFETLTESIKALEPLYRTEVRQLRREPRTVRIRNLRLFSPTTFEIMERHALEESHSNVLAYLLKHKRGGRALLEGLLTSHGTPKR